MSTTIDLAPGMSVIVEHGVGPKPAESCTVVEMLPDDRARIRLAGGGEVIVPRRRLTLEPKVRVGTGYRRTDPITSATAATAVRLTSGSLRELVLDVLVAAGPHGRTDHELEARLHRGRDTLSKRRQELGLQGLVIDSGTKRRTPRGRDAVVWVVTDAGREVWQRNRMRGAS